MDLTGRHKQDQNPSTFAALLRRAAERKAMRALSKKERVVLALQAKFDERTGGDNPFMLMYNIPTDEDPYLVWEELRAPAATKRMRRRLHKHNSYALVALCDPAVNQTSPQLPPPRLRLA